MTNEELIEEILIESHSLGISKEVLELSQHYREVNPHYDRYDSIQLAFNELTKNK